MSSFDVFASRVVPEVDLHYSVQPEQPPSKESLPYRRMLARWLMRRGENGITIDGTNTELERRLAQVPAFLHIWKGMDDLQVIDFGIRVGFDATYDKMQPTRDIPSRSLANPGIQSYLTTSDSGHSHSLRSLSKLVRSDKFGCVALFQFVQFPPELEPLFPKHVIDSTIDNKAWAQICMLVHARFPAQLLRRCLRFHRSQVNNRVPALVAKFRDWYGTLPDMKRVIDANKHNIVGWLLYFSEHGDIMLRRLGTIVYSTIRDCLSHDGLDVPALVEMDCASPNLFIRSFIEYLIRRDRDVVQDFLAKADALGQELREWYTDVTAAAAPIAPPLGVQPMEVVAAEELQPAHQPNVSDVANPVDVAMTDLGDNDSRSTRSVSSASPSPSEDSCFSSFGFDGVYESNPNSPLSPCSTSSTSSSSSSSSSRGSKRGRDSFSDGDSYDDDGHRDQRSRLEGIDAPPQYAGMDPLPPPSFNGIDLGDVSPFGGLDIPSSPSNGAMSPYPFPQDMFHSPAPYLVDPNQAYFDSFSESEDGLSSCQF